MGLHVHKNIGYYLPEEKISGLLNDNHEKLCDDLYSFSVSVERIQALWDSWKSEHPHLKNDYLLFTLQLKQWAKQSEEIKLNEIIKTIFDGDDVKGILFSTPDLNKKSRYDDLMDYYEGCYDVEYREQFLRAPISPESHYVCVRKPEWSKAIDGYTEDAELIHIENIEPGKIISENDFLSLAMVSKEEMDQSVYPEGRVKSFHPYVSPLPYLMACEAGLLLDGVDYLSFIQAVEPAIITNWC